MRGAENKMAHLFLALTSDRQAQQGRQNLAWGEEKKKKTHPLKRTKHQQNNYRYSGKQNKTNQNRTDRGQQQPDSSKHSGAGRRMGNYVGLSMCLCLPAHGNTTISLFVSILPLLFVFPCQLLKKQTKTKTN